MPTPSQTAKNTIELNLTYEQKDTLEKAAAIAGLSLTDYVIHQALIAGMEHIASYGKMVLNERDREIFMAALDNPPEPNEALKAAIKEHQAKYGNW